MAPQNYTAHNIFRGHDSPLIVVVEGAEGPARRQWLDSRMKEMTAPPGRKFILSCKFDSGGPWAGVSDLFLALWPEIRSQRPDLVDRHSVELVHILPQLQQQITVPHLTLTDVADDHEKVRNYAADRAFRNVHGLIDLIDEWNTASGVRGPWIIACNSFESAGKMCSHFFKELVRRRGKSLHLCLLLAVGPGKAGEVAASLNAGSSINAIKVDFAQESAPVVHQEMAEQMASELEQLVGQDPVQRRLHLPQLIKLWTLAARQDKVLRWRYYGLAIYLHLGLYEDALRYGRNLLALAQQYAPSDMRLQLWIVIKILNGLTAIQDAHGALKFVHEEASAVIEQAPIGFRGDILYLIAMVYARYSKPRDFAQGEAYLDRALEAIQQSELPPDELCFQQVFNRNGVAMIRNFQGRHDAAIELCRTGLEQLDLHVSPDKHRLHRSILTYNIAQVYSTTRQFTKAIEYYSATMEMDPNYSEYYNERGSIYLKLGLLEESLADYRKAAELSPPYFEVFANLGQCFREMGLMEEAIHHYSRALDLQPDLLLAFLGRAQAREALGQRDEAIADYSAALALDPGQWEAVASRGIVHYEMGRLDSSLADFNLAIQLDSQNPILYQNRAKVLAETGNFSDAISDLQTALALNPAEEDRIEIQDRLESVRQGAY